MLQNPILPGFNPDPCLCRKGGDYYLAVSSFEWFPGIPVYHSKDLKHWQLLTHVLTDDTKLDLKRLPSAKGIWAPCLTYCEREGLFYVVYGVMNSMNARYFEVDNYVITSSDICGPWSEPVYLHSAGFDASMLHDDDGRKWVVSLEWETRDGYEKPGAICLVEYDPRLQKTVGHPKRIWAGGTNRGCIEAPHLTRRGAYYYLMCAEGGTGYNHCVTMARAKHVNGPYEADPQNPIVTSAPNASNERHDPDHLKPQYFNPQSVLQKSGHGSYVETPGGETYLAHLCARPFVPELCCTLGRETAIQKMHWTPDGWLRMADGSNLAKQQVQEAALPAHPLPQTPAYDDFNESALANFYYAPRISPTSFADVSARQGFVRLRGQESLTSLNRVSFLARKLTALHADITTKMEFSPQVFQHSAGLALYYDNMNFIYLHNYFSETLGQPALAVLQLENGVRTFHGDTRIGVQNAALYLRLHIDDRQTRFAWSYDNKVFTPIGKVFETARFSDEACKFGEFTGAMAGLACEDRLMHQHCADFDFFEYCV